MKRKAFFLLAFFVFLFPVIQISLFGAKKAESGLQDKLIVFHAGSLSLPFEAMEKAFEAQYPNIDLQREAAGSTKCARKITELKKPCDIMASADYRVIDKLLIPEYADWNIRFATNQLVLCYTDTSAYADHVNANNWYTVLLKRDVLWGHADPNIDPCGYRALMVMQLAEKYYSKPGLFNDLIKNRPRENIRPKSVDLISLLQTGNMDYAWEYRSVTVQHGLRYITLPDEINLGNYKYDDFYAQASIEVTGEKPDTFMEMKGKSVTYGITMIKNATNKEGAILFLKYMLDPEGGLKVLKKNGQPPFIPARVPTERMKAIIPGELRGLVEVKDKNSRM